MNRREWLRQAGFTTLAFSGALGITPARRALAQTCPVVDLQRTVVNVMLQGGADFRFLFMPAPSHPDSAYLAKIWAARAALYPEAYPDYASMFEAEYLLTSDPLGGSDFGIFSGASWLHEQFTQGRVAVVANAVCSRNRRHDQSILNADAGEPDLAQLNFDRDGWGGRLIEAIGESANAVELGGSVSVFSKGSTPGARLQQVVHAEDMRNMALSGVDPDAPAGSRRNVLARALHGWFDAQAAEPAQGQPPAGPYQAFFDHRQALQAFGIQVNERLAMCQPLPESLATMQLANAGFAQQCRNLFDACQMPDILQQRVMSMSYGGWDTHDNQYAEITGNLADLFGESGGLAITWPELESLPYLEQPATEQLVLSFASDFGRQLRGNGTQGTDHGRGTYGVMVGAPVRGGVYGEMFPVAETQENSEGLVPLDTEGADITGLTSTERVQAAACDWCEAGTSAAVFPNAASAAIEQSGLLDNLFNA